MYEIRLSAQAMLRMLQMEDAAPLFALVDANRLHLRQWMPWVDHTKSVADTESFISSAVAQHEQNQGLTYGIRYQGRLVGIISVHGIDWTNRNTTIGYWLSADVQGKGLMTLAVTAYLDHLVFGEWGLNRAQINAAVENKRSRAIPERLGFQLEGILRQAQCLHDCYVDLAVYGMVAADWKKRVKNLN
ncbi:MAG: GNAT family N-acetyltransferase [Brevibacillus sp.]|nr:GNAT family N-acetyltransferase [Brevibacillus sp.]